MCKIKLEPIIGVLGGEDTNHLSERERNGTERGREMQK
jgi:hypothetical protein